VFYLNYINLHPKYEFNCIPEADLLKILPKTDFSFEMTVLNSVSKSDLSELKKVNEKEASKHYGNEASAIIVSNTTLRVLYEKISKITEKEVTFKTLTEKYSINIDELEEVITDAITSNLFDVSVDYQTSKVLIKYIKSNNFSKESLIDMKSKISLLKQKIIAFNSKIGSLAN